MRDREAYVGRLTEQLQSLMAETKTAQASLQELQREVATYKGMLARVGELVGDVAHFDEQMRSVASEILSKGTKLDKLAGSLKELAEALKSATKQTPTQ